MHTYDGRQAGRQTYRKTYRHTDGWMEGWIGTVSPPSNTDVMKVKHFPAGNKPVRFGSMQGLGVTGEREIEREREGGRELLIKHSSKHISKRKKERK